MSDTPAEAPATDPPGDKIYICPACGTRYDQPTTCANGHPPTETVEYDRATVEAADAGDEQAIADVAQTEADAAGAGAGAVASEASPAPVDPSAAAGATDASSTSDASSTTTTTDGGTPAGAATDQPAAPADPAPADPPAAASPASCSVTVTIDGVIYSGTISAA